MTTQPVIDHRGDSAPVAVVDDYPLGECPPVTTVDLCSIEERFCALVAIQLALGALAHYIGVDPFLSFSDELAELLHLPMEARA
ncbi:Uncharacterised protein [Mycobacteroides abscessus subsp. massiliense]|uniref:hypothetical protein n=1 Tax=Mycobacteroides abscessus TaxID=36809 RepID=UPI0009A7C6AF|nr:hypothetical protein [Mycobacteroides abscessus]SKH53636.1 Uncharacterised protein [Mycobacteroides abscessus subsp. massiliense]SKH84236.1 Uncharacterised protein [Mycobacteroides abscessus subsp. massiliense]SKK33541.1 Uncharacterised protein [Mycobacteroides abscessus subsp. massiliense]SKK45822.1 Uncharacterised protein [Mycobacteroides abscessus subsp. massiliense]SKL87427.1 Uncharacterised protein [Mycobacteroides abscessus subsp. massiliense]